MALPQERAGPLARHGSQLLGVFRLGGGRAGRRPAVVANSWPLRARGGFSIGYRLSAGRLAARLAALHAGGRPHASGGLLARSHRPPCTPALPQRCRLRHGLRPGEPARGAGRGRLRRAGALPGAGALGGQPGAAAGAAGSSGRGDRRRRRPPRRARPRRPPPTGCAARPARRLGPGRRAARRRRRPRGALGAGRGAERPRRADGPRLARPDLAPAPAKGPSSSPWTANSRAVSARSSTSTRTTAASPAARATATGSTTCRPRPGTSPRSRARGWTGR